jgi:hypothetical protein
MAMNQFTMDLGGGRPAYRPDHRLGVEEKNRNTAGSHGFARSVWPFLVQPNRQPPSHSDAVAETSTGFVS